MAYGGAGFAISYPLAMELEKMQERCIHRYPSLRGSDDRIQACMAELTKEVGVHQYDVHGELLGLLGAHPVAPLVSIHHTDAVEPIFPGMSRVKALKHLLQYSAKLNSASIMQQSICYDNRQSWSISVSWGYVVQIFRGVISPRELERPSRAFLNRYKNDDDQHILYEFNTRAVARHPCETPIVFYMSMVSFQQNNNQTVGIYAPHHKSPNPHCPWRLESPDKIKSIVVSKRPDPLRWQNSQRRDCCTVMPSRNRTTMYIRVDSCTDIEISEL